MRRDVSAPADPIDGRDYQAHDACQHSSYASRNASRNASFLGAQSGTGDGRSHREANAGRDPGDSRAEPLCKARAEVLRLVFRHHHVVLLQAQSAELRGGGTSSGQQRTTRESGEFPAVRVPASLSF